MFFPNDAVRVAAPSGYVNREVSDRFLRSRPEGAHDHRNSGLSATDGFYKGERTKQFEKAQRASKAPANVCPIHQWFQTR
jgi:hypothetical protein